jgi:hypothetical protein
VALVHINPGAINCILNHTLQEALMRFACPA